MVFSVPIETSYRPSIEGLSLFPTTSVRVAKLARCSRLTVESHSDRHKHLFWLRVHLAIPFLSAEALLGGDQANNKVDRRISRDLRHPSTRGSEQDRAPLPVASSVEASTQ